MVARIWVRNCSGEVSAQRLIDFSAPYMFVDRIARGIPIDKFGDGTSCRDYTFIDDIVSGILAALDNPRPCEVYNLGNNRVVSLNEFIAVIENTVGRKAIINQKPDQPGDVPITYADLAKSQAMLGYDPKHTIEEGMSKFVHWYFTRNDPRNMLGQISPPPSPAMVGAEEEDADFSDFSEEAADDDSSISSGASEDDGSVVSELVKGRFDARSTISSSSYGTLIARTPPPPAVASKFDITLTEDKLDFNPDDATDCGCGPTDSVDALEFSKLHLNTCNRAAVTVLEGSR